MIAMTQLTDICVPFLFSDGKQRLPNKKAHLKIHIFCLLIGIEWLFIAAMNCFL